MERTRFIPLVKRDSGGFMDWLRDFASGCGVDAVVADDLSTHKPVARRLGVERQICVARVKKWAWKRLDKIDGWDWVKARMLNGFGMTQWAWSGRDGLDLSELVAAQRRAIRWGGGCALRNTRQNDRPLDELPSAARYALY